MICAQVWVFSSTRRLFFSQILTFPVHTSSFISFIIALNIRGDSSHNKVDWDDITSKEVLNVKPDTYLGIEPIKKIPQLMAGSCKSLHPSGGAAQRQDMASQMNATSLENLPLTIKICGRG